MNLKNTFLICFAVACLPAVAWSVWIASRAQSDWSHATTAVRMAVAMGDALQLVEALSLERGVLQERALSDGPITGNLAETAASNDALLDRTQQSMRLAGLPDEAVTKSREILIDLRRLVAKAVIHPVTERDPGLAPAIMAQLYERLGAVQAAVARAEREAAQADARVGALVAIGSLAVDMRAAAGWRSSNLTGWLGGRVLTPDQLDEAMYMTGEVQYAWDRLSRQVLIAGEPPRLAAAVAATRDGFFRSAEPRYRQLLAIARAGGARPQSLTEWRHWTVDALAGTLFARDAAIAEALDYGRAVAFRAKLHLAAAAASTIGLFVLAAGALLVLLRRLVLPVGRLTSVVTRLANGNVTAVVPDRGRHDEIGAMAAAIEVFRENAVALQQTNLRFNAALSNMSQGLAMYDAEERLVVSNPRLCEITGVPPGSLRTGMTLREVLAVEASAGNFPAHMLDAMYAERRDLCATNATGAPLEYMRGGRSVTITSRVLPDGGCLFTHEDITERKRLDEALRISSERLELATESARIGIWDWDVVANKLMWDDRMYELYGIREQDFSGAYDAWQAGLHPDDLARGDAAIAAAIDHVRDFNIEFRVLWPNGEVHDIEAHALVQGEPHARATRMVGVNWDITARKRAEQALLSSEMKYRDLFESTRDAILVLEPPSVCFTSANFSAVKLFGARDEQEILARKPWELSPERQPDGRPSVEKAHAMIETVLREGTHAFEWVHRRLDGVEFPTDVLLTRGGREESVVIYSTIRDISDRKLAEQQIVQMARYDKLTALANRHVFVEALEQAIGLARRADKSFAVLYLDLDHFKDINDTLGHPVGDSLLRAVAERLQGNVREADTVARFGGDEFAVLVDDVRDPAYLTFLAERLLRAIGEPFVIDGNVIRSGTSVGVAVYGLDSSDAETLLSHADVALYRAKAEGRGSYRFFTEAMDTEVRARIAIGAELREAVAMEQFFLLYQPQVEIDTGRIVGLEALVRWRHPRKGVVGPGRFVGHAETNGLIVPLGRWVLRDACRQAKRWLDAGIAPPSVAVNLSAIQFKLPLELEKDIAATVAQFGLPPRLLELELTEGVLMDASHDHNDVLIRLREKGHHIAIDDFGSGYSSLDYLRRYPVDRIKIAQSFIANIGVEPGSDVIVRAALGLARELGIEVVVEGVETAAQLALLKTWGGLIVQGFYFARPLAVPDVTALLRAGRIAPALVEPLQRAAG